MPFKIGDRVVMMRGTTRWPGLSAGRVAGVVPYDGAYGSNRGCVLVDLDQSVMVGDLSNLCLGTVVVHPNNLALETKE